MKKCLSLAEPLCPPADRVRPIPPEQFVEMIRWHERKAEEAMQSLHCGSENHEYRTAGKIADAHWCAAALMRIWLGQKNKT